MKKYIFLIIVLCCCSGCFQKTQAMNNKLLEEVNPVRQDDKIVGIEYHLKLAKRFNDNYISTHIIDSIAHYKDLNNIDNFFVTVILENNSKVDYMFNDVLLKKDNNIINRFSYKIKVLRGDIIIFTFPLDDLDDSCLIELKLKK